MHQTLGTVTQPPNIIYVKDFEEISGVEYLAGCNPGRDPGSPDKITGLRVQSFTKPTNEPFVLASIKGRALLYGSYKTSLEQSLVSFLFL